ncbi:uncharacterized protein DUF1153 [Litoreibacter halocynthiae]|uniref:Uncharacterized protein DUF1153 n=1 Tax=Litoreibacter halocynthiae TaxID=1242689 RepID=A0A4R7LTR4_9RHOB|nr:DUF1153 domain-containing protein [Litoreibacter halocynthiae]TDT77660.1 uncharacterized protein DUF1153 [Litoreibacter halocynthiae]
MYLKRETGPRMVTLQDGSTMSRADLPDRTTRRWVASRKALVVRAVEATLISEDEACELYGLSEEELESWRNAVADHGVKALRATSLQNYRQNTAEKG